VSGERGSLATACLLTLVLAVLAGCGREPLPAPKPAPPPSAPAAPREKPPESAPVPPAQTQPVAPQPAPPEPPKATEGPAPVAPEQKLRRVKVLVSGRVQGVGFRAFTVSKANALGLTGTVRNLKDGRVEAFVEGPGDKVEELIKAVGTGPTGARVDGVLTEEQTHRGEFRSFTITQ
jgi:acylphosphatase